MTQQQPPARPPAEAFFLQYDPPRRIFAELIGTFALTFVAAGGGCIAALSGGGAGLAAIVFAPALLVTAMIFVLGPVSGAHFNPVVTLAFALRRDFPARYVPGYWLAQLVGATLAALLLRALFGTAGNLGATLPHHGLLTSAVMEGILTFFLLSVILATAHSEKLVGHVAAFAVGSTIALDGLFAAPISGASMNPARSFGPDLIGWQMGTYWVYLAGPIVGAILAVGVAFILRGPGSAYAKQVATGEG